MLILRDFIAEIEVDYDDYRFASVLKRLSNFLEEFSALYLDPVRDRLYCDPEDGVGRRSAQTLLHYVLRVVLHTIAPILPHMADEFHHHRKDILESDVSVMKLRWLTANDIINQVSSTSQSRMARMFRDSLAVRKYVF